MTFIIIIIVLVGAIYGANILAQKLMPTIITDRLYKRAGYHVMVRALIVGMLLAAAGIAATLNL